MAVLQRAVGLFSNYQTAEASLGRLKDSGFDMDKVSVVAKNTDEDTIEGADVTSESNQVASTAKTGATTGGIGGGAIGLIGSLGVLAIPGVGPVAELGVLLANTLFGGVIGAAGGGIVGALVGWGLPKEKAEYYNRRVYDNGDYLVLVEGSHQDIQTAETVLRDNSVTDWHRFTSEPTLPSATATGTAADTSRQPTARRKLRRLRNRQPV